MARRRRRNRGSKGRPKDQRQRKDDPTAFWGAVDPLPEPRSDVRPASEPALAVTSLGPPPLPGREVIAAHYFEAVYGRVTGVSGALAVAAGMLDPGTLEGQDEDAPRT